MKICPNCGSEVLENAEYCTRCGWHFEKAIRPQSAADPIDKHQDTAKKSPLISQKHRLKKPICQLSMPISQDRKPMKISIRNWQAMKTSGLIQLLMNRPKLTNMCQLMI